jgi:C_GCAxxG_C_C family probable redox protein
VQDTLDVRDDSIIRVATVLSGGIGRMHDTCGVLLGACLMLGLKYGRGREELDNLKIDNDLYDILRISAESTGRFYKWFEREFGSVKCHELRKKFANGIYYNIHVPWQRELYEEAKVPEQCIEMVKKTAVKVTEILWDVIKEEKVKKNTKSA